MIEDMGVVCNEDKRVNMVVQWCIDLCYVDFKVMELYAVKLWARVVTEVPYTSEFPINSPSIKNSKKI